MNNVIFFSVFAMAFMGSPNRFPPPLLDVPKARFDQILEAPGVIDATGGSLLAAPQSSLPKQILKLKPEGDFVRTGEAVAEFDSTPLENRIEELRNRFQEMKLSLGELTALQQARHLDGKLRMDGTRGTAALAEIDRKRLAHESRLRISQSDADVATARRRIDSAGNQLALVTLLGDKSLSEASRRADAILQEIDDLTQDIQRFTLVAENDGFVVYQPIPLAGQVRKPQPGDFLESAQVFGRIPGADAFVARIHLDERQAVLAKSGMPVEVRLRSHPDEIVPGTLLQILPTPATLPGRGNRPFQEALVKLPKQLDLKIGESVMARIPLKNLKNVYAVPRDYLEGSTLWIKRADGLAAVTPKSVFESDDFVAFETIPSVNDGSPLRIAMPPFPNDRP
jgi:multidrug efflux pump subunit AcrA (membrane-fusion protein)